MQSFVFQSLLMVIVLSIFCQFVWSGKDQDVRKRPSTRNTNSSEDDPATRSLAQWQRRSLESLRLNSDHLHLVSSGTRSVLARRLYDHYHHQPEASVDLQTTLPPPSTSSSTEPTAIDPSQLIRSTEFQSVLRQELQSILDSLITPALPTSTPEPINNVLPTSIPNSATGNIELPQQQNQIHQGTGTAPLPFSEDIAAINTTNSLINSLLAAQSQPSSSHQRSATLPALPKSVLDLIRDCKFINFDDLLPAVAPLNMDEYSIKIGPSTLSGDSPSVSLIPNRRARSRVTDFYTWSTAWNNFLQALSVFRPQLLPSLIHYQSLITKFACQYSFSAWFTYDRLFRYTMANNASLSWARVDDDIFNRYLRGAQLRSICFSCNNYGHLSTNCPLRTLRTARARQDTSTNVSPPSDSSRSIINNNNFSTTPNQPFRAPQRFRNQPSQYVCRFYNSGQCTYANCRYMHRCRICSGAHPQSSCPQQKN